MSGLNGRDYIAVRRLTDRAGHVVAAVGERCDRVTPSSLPFLLRDGDIRPAPSAPAQSSAAAAVPPAPAIDTEKDGEA